MTSKRANAKGYVFDDTSSMLRFAKFKEIFRKKRERERERETARERGMERVKEMDR